MKTTKKILLFIMTFILAFSAVACINDPDSDKTKLKISFFKAGFGDEWLKATAAAFEEINPTVKVVLEGNEDMDTLVKSRFNSGKKDKISDIVSVTNHKYYLDYVREGYIENLDDLYGKEVENGKKLIELIEESFLDLPIVQGSRYGIPWEGAVTGFAYNVKLFNQYGWTVPKTMDEFYDLCIKIKAKGVAPVSYSGSAAEGYFGNLHLSWSMQYEGPESAEEFFKMENPEVFLKEGRLKAYEQVGRIVSDQNIRLTGSNGNDHLAAQRAFIKGEAAMLPTGSWLETEMSAFLKDYPSFEMAMFPVPSILSDANGNPVDKNGNPALPTSASNSDLLCVPTDAPNKQLAKDFLMFMSRQDMLKLYVEKTGGNPRPFKIENTDWSKLSTFGKSVINTWQTSNNVFPYSTAPAFLKGNIAMNIAENGTFCTYLQNATSVTDAVNVRAKHLFDKDYEIIKVRFHD